MSVVPCRKSRTDDHPGNLPDEERDDDRDADLTEPRVGDCTCDKHRDSLGEVGSDEDRWPQQRVEEDEDGDHERAGADARHPDDKPDDEAEDDRAHDLHLSVDAGRLLVCSALTGSSREVALRKHCDESKDQDSADPRADGLVGPGGREDGREDPRADKDARY